MGPSNISFLSFRVIFHFHDYGRKCIYYVNFLEIKSHPSFFFKGYIDSNGYSVFSLPHDFSHWNFVSRGSIGVISHTRHMFSVHLD